MSEPKIEFSDIIMSSIHDIKNSLLLSLNTVDDLYPKVAKLGAKEQRAADSLHYEIQRINNSLIQLLSLYKMDNKILNLNVDHHNVYDFLDEQVLHNSGLQQSGRLTVELECDEMLEWYFDAILVSGIINTILNNALRYAQRKITLFAQSDDNYLTITIDDDGDGFPESMLDYEKSMQTNVNFVSGSTGLGLFFASKVAELHQYEGLKGEVAISNTSVHGGGRFILRLPGRPVISMAEALAGLD